MDVIELNRAIREVVDEDLRGLSGGPYSLPGVSTAIGDGRSTLSERDERYDQVHLGFTDTYSGNSAQAFALTENNLYTVEAFQEYLEHLTPGGVLNVSRPDREGINEALRATVLAFEALDREGVPDPGRNVVVLLGKYASPFSSFAYGTVLAKREPFTDDELRLVRRLAGERAQGVAYAPGGPYAPGWDELAAAPDHRAFCEAAAFDYCAPTDDRPFFFNLQRVGHFGETAAPGGLRVPDPTLILAITLAILLVLSAAAFALPLALVRGEGRPSVASLGFFAAIGLGFLVLEVVLIQRFVLFLGFPTYALSVVLFALLVFTGLGLAPVCAGWPRRCAPGARRGARRLRRDDRACRVRASAAAARPHRPAVRRAHPAHGRAARAARCDARDGHAPWHAAAGGAVSERRGVGVGNQRHCVRPRLRPRDHRGDHARLHRGDVACAGLLPRGAGTRPRRPLARVRRCAAGAPARP